MQGGGAVGGDIEGADEGGVEDADLEETRELGRDLAKNREPTEQGDEGDGRPRGFRRIRGPTANRPNSRAEDAAAAFAAALSAVDARRAARPDPAVTIARLTERNRALRRELGVAQRLMTGEVARSS